MNTKRTFLVQFTVLAFIAVASQGAAAQPAELTLYGARLKDATVDSFTHAAIAAGALRKTGNEFDARKTAVPALESFRLLAAGPTLIGIQFNVERYGENNEKLRQMLVAKYGKPRNERGGADERFTSQYLGDGSRHWTFADGMRLVYKQPFSSREATTLTYVDQNKLDAAERKAKGKEAKDASKKAQSLSDKF